MGGAVVEVEAAGAPKEKVGFAAAAGTALTPPKSPPPAAGAPAVDVAGAPNSDVVVPAGLAPKSPPPVVDVAGAVELPNREGAAVPDAGWAVEAAGVLPKENVLFIKRNERERAKESDGSIRNDLRRSGSRSRAEQRHVVRVVEGRGEEGHDERPQLYTQM